MTALLAAVFVASLTGSLHCAGMCGPFALMAGLCGSNCASQGGQRAPRTAVWMTVAGYHLGRMTSYVAVGAVAGSLGAAVDLGGSWAGWQRSATWLAGLMMVLVGTVALLRQAGWIRRDGGGPGWLARRLQPMLRRVAQFPPLARATGIGLLTVLLPCGWLYVFAITAAGTGSPSLGALTMLVFWSGTVPVLLALAAGAGSVAGRLRWNVPALTAVLVIALGCYTMFWRAPVVIGGEGSLRAAGSPAQAATRLATAASQPLPCCHCSQPDTPRPVAVSPEGTQ